MVGGYCGARRGNAVSHAMRGKRDHVHLAFNHPHFVGAFCGTGFRNPIKFAAFLEQRGFGRVKVFGRRTLIQQLTTKSDDAGGETYDVKCFVRNAKGNLGASGDKKPTFEVLGIIICGVSFCGAAKTPCQQRIALRASVLFLSAVTHKKSSGFFSSRPHPSSVFPSAAIAPRCVNRTGI